MTLPSKKMELQLAINSLTTETFEQLLRFMVSVLRCRW